MLSVTDLNFSFRKTAASVLFKGLNLRITKPEHVVIVGDSDGGKSTLLNLIADTEQAAIKLDASKSVTMLLQEGALLDDLSVIENLRLIAHHSSRSSINDVDIIASLERLGITYMPRHNLV